MSDLLLVKPTAVVLVKLFFRTLHVLYNYMLNLTKFTISEQKNLKQYIWMLLYASERRLFK